MGSSQYCKANTDNKEKIAGILFDQRNLTLLTVLVKNALDIKHLAETFQRHQTALTQVWPFHPENQKFHHYF